VDGQSGKKGSTFQSNTGLQSNDNLFALTSTNAIPNNALGTVGALLANSNCSHVVTNGNYIYYADAVGHVKRSGALSSC
jgi:hypothetical protein